MQRIQPGNICGIMIADYAEYQADKNKNGRNQNVSENPLIENLHGS